MNIQNLHDKARELCAKYNEPTVLEVQVWAWPDGGKSESFRIHAVGQGDRSVANNGANLAEVEAWIADKLDPQNRIKNAIAQAEALEAEAAALRAKIQLETK